MADVGTAEVFAPPAKGWFRIRYARQRRKEHTNSTKVLFFGSHCERLCQVQFSLISLIPGLVRTLQDCANPQMDHDAETRQKPDSVRTSDRSSLLSYVGLPLQLFGKGSFFGPYTPLQQLDLITDLDTKSYVIGSTNSLLLQQKERYCDALLNLDDNVVTVLSPSIKSALTLSVADRRWIDFLTQAVNDTWDPSDPSRPSTHGYAGSEEFIRLQFEEYLIALMSSTKYHQYMVKNKDSGKSMPSGIDGDPAADFSMPFIEAWQQSENYRLWNRTTDDHLFDIAEPKHPCAGGLTIDDVQRRLAAQVAELHLDERINQTREVVGKRFADGRVQVTSALNKVWADIEAMREAQRKRAEEPANDKPPSSPTSDSKGAFKADLHSAGATVASAGQRAGAFFSSWGTWANNKRHSGWARSASANEVNKVDETKKVDTTTVPETMYEVDDTERGDASKKGDAKALPNKDENEKPKAEHHAASATVPTEDGLSEKKENGSST